MTKRKARRAARALDQARPEEGRDLMKEMVVAYLSTSDEGTWQDVRTQVEQRRESFEELLTEWTHPDDAPQQRG